MGGTEFPCAGLGHYYRYLRPVEYTMGPLVQLIVGVAITVIGGLLRILTRERVTLA